MHISIVNTEKTLINRVATRLKGSGYVVNMFYGYDQFIQNSEATSHLYIIDQHLGEVNGVDLIRWLRDIKKSQAPILMTSGYVKSENIIQILNAGADDCLVKPFDFDELTARIQALLRRTTYVGIQKSLDYKDISFFPDEKEVRLKNEKVHLTKKEFLFVELFLFRPVKIIDRGDIISYIWGSQKMSTISDNTINATLSKLRKKLLGNFMPKPIYNYGYILE